MPFRKRDRRGRRANTDVTVQRVHDGEMYVRVSTIGTHGERPFVLVPGIGVSSNYFERLAPHLNEFGPVHALDLPGFGGVRHPPRLLTIPEYADLVGLVIDRLDLHDPILVGHSMGTQVVTDLAARRPDLSTLVLIGPVVNADERSILTQARRFLQSAWHEPARVKVLAVSSYFLCGFRWFSRILPEMLSYPLEEQLTRVRAATLLIRGEHDANSPAGWIEHIAAQLPRARAWEIPGAAHSVMYAHAEDVARLCVVHARDPDPGEGPTTLERLPLDLFAVDEDDPTPEQMIESLAARLTEFRGLATENDDLIAKGKTAHAEANDSDEDD